MHTTDNYQLSQWDAADRILMSDFNSDNAKIDAAIAGLAADLAAAGNLRAEVLTYTGTGAIGNSTSPAVTVTFSTPPVLVIVCNQSGGAGLLGGRSSSFHTFAPVSGSTISDGTCHCIWSEDGAQVSWYANYANTALNVKDVAYTVYALTII